MDDNILFSDIFPNEYIGRILHGDYSAKLKNRITEWILSFRTVEKSGLPIIPYISAWRDNDKEIWYEYAGRQFPAILGCDISELVDVFRGSIIDRRVYQPQKLDPRVKEVIIPQKELVENRIGIRAEGKKKGAVDAIYQLAVQDDKIIWLKDQANIHVFKQDKVCVSLGCLTDITMEMEQKRVLEKIGYLDELTKLPKKNALLRILEINIGQFQRKQINDFVFLMIDIDHFKKVNDTYGHQAGDNVLRTLAEVMVKTKRKADEIGRYGGEEFYGVSNGNIGSGLEFAGRLRRQIEATRIQTGGVEISVTVSLGVVSASELEELTIEGLIERADRRLYSAKQSGRNCVVANDQPERNKSNLH